MNRFLIIRFGSIGNTLVSIPAVRAIKRQIKDSSITMIVSPGIDELISGIKWIDDILVYDMHGEHKSLKGYLSFIHNLRSRRFDTAIMFKRFLRSELIGLLSGAKRRIGFVTDNRRSYLLTDGADYIEGDNIIGLNMKLVAPLGITDNDLSLELGIDNNSISQADQIIDKIKTTDHKSYAVIHPGGRTIKGEGLPVESYSRLIYMLEKMHRIPSIVIGDTSENEIIDKIISLSGTQFTLKASGLPLRQIAYIIKQAEVFIGNDSGPCHIADAVKTPGVIIYPPMLGLETHLQKWKPLGGHYVAIIPPKSCGACSKYPCDQNSRIACMRNIDIEAIVNYAVTLIKGRT